MLQELTKGAVSGSSKYSRPTDFASLADPTHCGKVVTLEKLLTRFRAAREKCVVFSWSTQTLDVLEALCISKGWPYQRLDGKSVTIFSFTTDGF